MSKHYQITFSDLPVDSRYLAGVAASGSGSADFGSPHSLDASTFSDVSRHVKETILRLDLVIEGSSKQVLNLRTFSLVDCRNLTILSIVIRHSPNAPSSDAVEILEGLTRALRTLPKSVSLASCTIEGAFPPNITYESWIRSPVIAALRMPAYNLDYRLVKLVDAGTMERIIIAPQRRLPARGWLRWFSEERPEVFRESDIIKMRYLFPAISDYDMVEFRKQGA